jgi:hypothetical protein
MFNLLSKKKIAQLETMQERKIWKANAMSRVTVRGDRMVASGNTSLSNQEQGPYHDGERRKHANISIPRPLPSCTTMQPTTLSLFPYPSSSIPLAIQTHPNLEAVRRYFLQAQAEALDQACRKLTQAWIIKEAW